MSLLDKVILQRAYQKSNTLFFNEASIIDLVRQVCLDVRCDTELNEDLSVRCREEYGAANSVPVCQHNYIFQGNFHGEASYECDKCGATKWV